MMLLINTSGTDVSLLLLLMVDDEDDEEAEEGGGVGRENLHSS